MLTTFFAPAESYAPPVWRPKPMVEPVTPVVNDPTGKVWAAACIVSLCLALACLAGAYTCWLNLAK